MKQKRNYIDEILDKKGRLFPTGERWGVVSSRLSTIKRILKLLEVLDPDSEVSSIIDEYLETNPNDFIDFDYSDVSDEILRYIPISLVACMEGYFKLIYAELIDTYPEFRQNAAKFNFSFHLETIVLSEKHSITVGELVAHLLPANSLDAINKNLSIILGQDFLSLFRNARPKMVRQLTLFPIDEERKTGHIIRTIDNLCILRNRYAHEIAPPVNIEDKDTVFYGVDAVADFLWVSEKIFSSPVNDN